MPLESVSCFLTIANFSLLVFGSTIIKIGKSQSFHAKLLEKIFRNYSLKIFSLCSIGWENLCDRPFIVCLSELTELKKGIDPHIFEILEINRVLYTKMIDLLFKPPWVEHERLNKEKKKNPWLQVNVALITLFNLSVFLFVNSWAWEVSVPLP